jgi:hypothetical protein
MSVRVTTPTGSVPSPMTDVQLPTGLSLGLGALGLVTCDQRTLEWSGPPGCSPNAMMGFGSALVEVPFGPVILKEAVTLSLYMAPSTNGHTSMLVYADGKTPVDAGLVFPAALLSDSGPFGACLDTKIPLTPSVPGAPDAAVVSMKTSIGPERLTYVRRIHGKAVRYSPAASGKRGRCPRGGAHFVATFKFQDGTTTKASAIASCALHS